MNRISVAIAFVVAFMVVASTSAQAQSVKIGYVDFDQILVNTAAGKRATKRFEKFLKMKQATLDRRKRKLQQTQANLQKQRSLMRPIAFKQRTAQLQKMYVELQQLYIKLERDLVTQRTKLIQQIIKQVRPVLTRVAKQRGFTMIIDRTAVVWAAKGHDLTRLVKAQMK